MDISHLWLTRGADGQPSTVELTTAGRESSRAASAGPLGSRADERQDSDSPCRVRGSAILARWTQIRLTSAS